MMKNLSAIGSKSAPNLVLQFNNLASSPSNTSVKIAITIIVILKLAETNGKTNAKTSLVIVNEFGICFTLSIIRIITSYFTFKLNNIVSLNKKF